MLEAAALHGEIFCSGGGQPRRCSGGVPLYTRVRTFIDPGWWWCTVSGDCKYPATTRPTPYTDTGLTLATVVVVYIVNTIPPCV